MSIERTLVYFIFFSVSLIDVNKVEQFLSGYFRKTKHVRGERCALDHAFRGRFRALALSRSRGNSESNLSGLQVFRPEEH